MKFKSLCFLIAALLFPLISMACGGGAPEHPIRHHVRYFPIVGDKTTHWPSEIKMVIGSLASFLVPIDTKIELGASVPLTILDEASHKTIQTSRYLLPAWTEIEYDTKKYKWIDMIVSGVGVGEVQMNSPGGWSKTISVTSIYAAETENAVRPPVQLILDTEEQKTVRVDGYDNFEVTVAGKVADGWTASPASETGFDLIRIQQVEKIYYGAPDFKESAPIVKLFFASKRSPKTTTVVLHQGGWFGRTIKFKIEALPTALSSCEPEPIVKEPIAVPAPIKGPAHAS